jgi:hypothetical protein
MAGLIPGHFDSRAMPISDDLAAAGKNRRTDAPMHRCIRLDGKLNHPGSRSSVRGVASRAAGRAPGTGPASAIGGTAGAQGRS